jgi:hypothetical protein
MKRTAILGFTVLVIASALAVFSIPWFTIAGGGGTSTNGQYSLTATIGQHDAGGSATNAQYSVTGEFWAATLVQTSGAPFLHISDAAPGFATIWWTPATPGYVLQSTASLSSTNWANAPSGTNNPATVATAGLARFYRIFKP